MHRAFHLWMLLGLAGGLSAAVPEIVPQQVAPVNGPEHFQPSGLAVVDGALFTVSDKHDQAIYALTLADGECTARPVLEITGLAETRKLDLEGLVTEKQMREADNPVPSRVGQLMPVIWNFSCRPRAVSTSFASTSVVSLLWIPERICGSAPMGLK